MRKTIIVAFAAVLAAVATACGGDSDAATAPDRTVRIDMIDTAFTPDTLEVAQGETVRFVFSNRGRIAHDAFIGDAAAQRDHEAEMRAADKHDHGGHSGGDAITVKPGKTGELTHTFADSGSAVIGCHQTGHWANGMKIDITIKERESR